MINEKGQTHNTQKINKKKRLGYSIYTKNKIKPFYSNFFSSGWLL